MIFNHPSAYIYTNSCSTSQPSSPRNSYLQWTPEPHVGASEGPAWSPYLRSPLSISPRSGTVLSGCVPDPVSGEAVQGTIRSQAIAVPRGPSWTALLLERTPQDSTPPLSPSSVSSSSSSSFSELNDDNLPMAVEHPAFESRKRRTTLESMVREPPCPIPSQTKVIVP